MKIVTPLNSNFEKPKVYVHAFNMTTNEVKGCFPFQQIIRLKFNISSREKDEGSTNYGW